MTGNSPTALTAGRSKFYRAILLILALVIAACGGDGGNPATTSTGTPGPAPTDPSDTTTTSGPQLEGSNRFEVTIEGQLHRFENIHCMEVGFSGVWWDMNAESPEMSLNLPLSDQGSNAQIRVTIDGTQWNAVAHDEALPDGESQVDDFTFSGAWETGGFRAVGTATFINTDVFYAEGEVVSSQGPFELLCPTRGS